MLILDRNPGAGQLQEVFREVDGELAVLEQEIIAAKLPLTPALENAIMLVKRLLVACIADEGKKRVPDASAEDILDVFKVLVKGEPTWNAIRDSCRELVYYRNCINMGRQDALPAAAEKMAVRTARHIYLYMKTRCIRDGRLEGSNRQDAKLRQEIGQDYFG